MNRWIYLHPLLLAVAPIFFLVAHNPHEADPTSVVGVLVVMVLGASAALGVSRWLLGDLGRGALLASVFVFLFHAYGRAFDASWDHEFFGKWKFESSRSLHMVLGTASLLMIVSAFVRLRLRPFKADNLAKVLTTFAGLMTLFSVWNITSDTLSAQPEAEPAAVAKRAEIILKDQADKPDVYYIILDGYARQDVLKKFYRYDNKSFIKSLRDRGFYVADNSRSTYTQTFLSLTSTLEMEYLDQYYSVNAEEMDKRPAIYKRLTKHKVGKRFQSHGYRYVHFNTNFSATQSMKHADIAYSFRPPQLQTEFISVLLRTTMLRPLEPDVASMYLYMLDKVKEVPSIKGPTFTFLHLLMPHNPYVFDKKGNIRNNVPLTLQLQEKTGGWRAKREYIEQLRYVNRRILEIVDSLIAKSKYPPVIILQSDHGSASSYRAYDNPLRRAKSWHERTATLNAWYAPPAVQARLTDNMVSVNTFRILFSELFGDNLPELPRKVNFSWYSYPYRFINVTREVEFTMGEPAEFWNPNSGYPSNFASDTAAPMVSDPADTGRPTSTTQGVPPE